MENIVLQSDEFEQSNLEPPPVTVAAIDFELQYRRRREQNRIRLFEQAFIEQTQGLRDDKMQNTTKRITYHVGFLSPHPHVIKHEERRFLYCALMCLAVAGGLAFSSSIGVALLLATLGCLCMLIYLKTRKQLTLFLTRAAKAPVIVLESHSKNADMIQALTLHLSTTITDNPLPADINRLAEETRLLRHFKEKGFISAARYQRHRDAIFKLYPAKH